jgi:hypothetical protein
MPRSNNVHKISGRFRSIRCSFGLSSLFQITELLNAVLLTRSMLMLRCLFQKEKSYKFLN